MITAEEQIDLFHNKYTYDLIKLFDEIKEHHSNTILLGKCDRHTLSDFIELILNNIDLKKMFLKHYKL